MLNHQSLEDFILNREEYEDDLLSLLQDKAFVLDEMYWQERLMNANIEYLDETEL